MTPLSTGMPLAERYLLIEQLGSGGMSVVWRGFDDVLGRPVAVKVLSAPTAADPAFRAAIRKEARASARLSHPNITQVYDYGEADLPDGPTVSYVVMELLDGQTLWQRMNEGPLPWREAVGIAAQVAQALAAAHRRGIVHRDIAPANVMLTATGAKVLDFGIAALAGGRGDPDGGGLLGTPAYVAPERLDDAPAAPAADVYALGALLYEMLAGTPPVEARTWTALVEAYRAGPDIPALTVPGLPEPVAHLVARCLAATPAARPGTAEVAQLLTQALGLPDMPDPSGTGLAATRLLPMVADEDEPLLDAGTAGEAAGRSRRLALGVAAVAVLVLVVAALVAGVLSDDKRRPAVTLPSYSGVTTPAASASGPESPAASPTGTHSAPAGGGGASPSHHPSATPSASAVSGLAVTDALISKVQTYADAGDIRGDVALDLENVLHQLRNQILAGQPVDYGQWSSSLRNKISLRIGENAITESSGMDLLALTDQLAHATA